MMVSGCMPSGTKEKAGASKHQPLSGPLDHFFPVHPQLAIKLNTHNSFFIFIFFVFLFSLFVFYFIYVLFYISHNLDNIHETFSKKLYDHCKGKTVS